MGNQRKIYQVLPRKGLDVVVPIRPSHSADVRKLIDVAGESGTFYTYFCPAGDVITFPNLDGLDVDLGPASCDYVLIQSGGKMWCGYEKFVEHVRTLAHYLGNSLFYVGDSEDYIDEYRITDGDLKYRRVHEGCWWPVEDYIQSIVE